MSEVIERNLTLEAINTVCEGTAPTLKAIAAALDVPQQRIYSVAKQPKAGEVYDRNAYNWDAIDRFVTRRLDPDKNIGTHEEVLALAVEKDKLFKTSDGRRGTRATTKDELVLPDGSGMPARKKELSLGQEVMLRQDKEPIVYAIILLTETHAVLQRKDWPTLQAYSNWTLNQKLITDPEQFAQITEERLKALAARAEASNTVAATE